MPARPHRRPCQLPRRLRRRRPVVTPCRWIALGSAPDRGHHRPVRVRGSFLAGPMSHDRRRRASCQPRHRDPRARHSAWPGSGDVARCASAPK
jgi:hypothetical protein